MKNFIYEIEERHCYNSMVDDAVEYRVKFKKLFEFLWWKWYSSQREGEYINRWNEACDFQDAFATSSKEEIDNFIIWVKILDGTLN